MKSSCLPLCLSLAVFSLFWTPSAGLKTLNLGSCMITTNLEEMQNEFSQIRERVPEDQCCFLSHILELYLVMVFRNYPTPDIDILRKISSLANSFLAIKKNLSLCHDQMTCPCGEEALEKFNQIQNHFKQLELQKAVVKAVEEIDIILQWMEKAR
uniref:Interleukin family protein n=1 Tax=Pipistrellus kuhlii TaxID=59472 RepID=A0A7J7UTI3_PIPKU|nr:interleukin 20 [Pipistrellus kuhlii]